MIFYSSNLPFQRGTLTDDMYQPPKVQQYGLLNMGDVIPLHVRLSRTESHDRLVLHDPVAPKRPKRAHKAAKPKNVREHVDRKKKPKRPPKLEGYMRSPPPRMVQSGPIPFTGSTNIHAPFRYPNSSLPSINGYETTATTDPVMFPQLSRPGPPGLSGLSNFTPPSSPTKVTKVPLGRQISDPGYPYKTHSGIEVTPHLKRKKEPQIRV